MRGLPRRPPAVRGSCAGFAFQARDELVQAQLLERAADRRELTRAQLDQSLALADERERLVEARLAGVQPPDDLLDACGRRLIGLWLSGRGCGRLCARGLIDWGGVVELAHRSRILADSEPSAKRSFSSPALRAPAAVT